MELKPLIVNHLLMHYAISRIRDEIPAMLHVTLANRGGNGVKNHVTRIGATPRRSLTRAYEPPYAVGLAKNTSGAR